MTTTTLILIVLVILLVFGVLISAVVYRITN